MKAATALVTTVLAAALIAGCIPEKRIVWSPDGKRAVVATPKGLFLIDGDGNVLKPRLTGSPTRCNWFPDNCRLAVVHKTTAKKWADVEDMFNSEQTTKMKALAKTLRERALAYEGDWDAFKVDPDDTIPSSIEVGAFLYLRDHLAEGLPEKLGDKWKEVKELNPDIWQLQIFTVTQDDLEPGAVLVRTFHEIHEPRVAPNGKNITLLMPLVEGTDDKVALQVVACEGGEARVVAEDVGLGHDWSPDGCCLVFIQSSALGIEASAQVQLGSLVTMRIAKEDGSLLPQWETREELVGLLFNPLLSVRWMSDGRLLFSSFEATLPATTSDMPQRWSLFVFDPSMPASVHRVLGRDFAEPLEASMPSFELSPDEKRVLLPGPNGQVVLHDFASRETKPLVAPVSPHGEFESLPAWRNNAEVCLVRPAEADQGGKQVALWKEGETKTLSGNWPEEMKEDWLLDNRPEGAKPPR
ncbi:MAG: hypothetical protein JXQ75_19520 [Phycisphaerae bacterium]|nr:hypothetical protein [Phycisphaerae bacterium]